MTGYLVHDPGWNGTVPDFDMAGWRALKSANEARRDAIRRARIKFAESEKWRVIRLTLPEGERRK